MPARRNKQTEDSRATTRVAPTLGNVVGAFKSRVVVENTRRVKNLEWPPLGTQVWPRNDYEQMIRSDESLERIRQYHHLQCPAMGVWLRRPMSNVARTERRMARLIDFNIKASAVTFA